MRPFVAPRSHSIETLERIADRPEIGDAHALILRQTFAEVAHLRGHLSTVQGVATRERDRRMLAELDARRKVALCDAGADALSRMRAEFMMMRDTLLLVARDRGIDGAEEMDGKPLCEAITKAVEAVQVVAPPAPPEAPIRRRYPRSSRWKDAEARISAAVDAGQDPDPKDMDIVREEAETAANVQAAQKRVADSWLGTGTNTPEVKDLIAIDHAERNLEEDDE